MSLATIQTILLIIYVALTVLLMGMRLTWSEVKSLADVVPEEHFYPSVQTAVDAFLAEGRLLDDTTAT